MPDDEVTCLVWSEVSEEATWGYHDSDVLARRGYGWVDGAGRVVLGVTHWCADICPPAEEAVVPVEVARRLERERDEARQDVARWVEWAVELAKWFENEKERGEGRGDWVTW